MKNAIQNKTPIIIELLPNRDVSYIGICLKESYEVFILIGLNEDCQEYDGIIILRSQEIEEYRYLDNEELSKIKNNIHHKFVDMLPLDKMNTFHECLDILKEKELIAIYTADDDESYYVGKIKLLSDDYVIIDLIDEDAKWLESQRIAVKDITYIGFDSSYEKQLIDKIK